MATIMVKALTVSTSALIDMQFGDGEGTIVGYEAKTLIGNNTGPVNENSPQGTALTHFGTADMHTMIQIWNLQTAAPPVFLMQHFMPQWEDRCILWNTIVPQTELIISPSAGTINGGNIYVQLYARPNIVVSRNFVSSPGREWDIGVLPASAGALVLCSYDMGFSAGSSGLFSRVSTDGSSFDEGASDYRRGYVRTAISLAQLINYSNITDTPGTTEVGMFAIRTGLPILTRSMHQSYDIQVMSGDARISMGTREARQIETTIRVAGGAQDITLGTGYAVKYAL